LLIDDSLAFPGRRARPLLSAEERRRLAIRDTISWALVGLIHVLFFMLLVVSLQQNRDRLGRHGAMETMLDLTMPHLSNAPQVDLIRPPDQKSQDEDSSAKPLTIIPPKIEIIPPQGGAASPGDVLNSVGQALACGASNFENLNRVQQAHCRRQPWQGVIMPNGTIVLDAPQHVPPPQIHMSGAEALRQQMQTNSGCPIISNMPCLDDMFSGNNSRAPGIPAPN
jgi:hypothetical protein